MEYVARILVLVLATHVLWQRKVLEEMVFANQSTMDSIQTTNVLQVLNLPAETMVSAMEAVVAVNGLLVPYAQINLVLLEVP